MTTEGQTALLVSKFVPGRHDDDDEKKKKDHSGQGRLTFTRPD